MKTKLTILMLIASVLCVEAQSWTWLEDQLSYAREGLSSAVLDDSIFYSGGRLFNNSFQNTVDIYDIGDNQWSSVDLTSSGRFISAMVSAGGKVFIAGGNNYPGTENFSDVDVFDKTTGEWTIEDLSEDRAVYSGAVACGNKVFFAGGHYHTNGATATAYTDVIDIYDTETNTWSIDYLSVQRGFIGSVAVGNKVYFAGGAIGTHAVTDVIDIYDIETEEWTVEYLTEGRAFIAAVAYNDKIYFAGGCKQNSITSTIIEVYDVTTGQWGETMNLQSTRLVFGINVNNALVFSGVCNNVTLSGVIGIGSANGIVEVYYPETGHWDYEIPDLNPARILYACTSYGNKVYHAGGWTGQYTINNINILECLAPQIIHVPGDQPTIQAGIDVATHGDTVLVDEGTYYENINFKGKAITVASQFLMDGVELHIENTIIDGSQPANPDSASVVYFISGEDTSSIIKGFTITGGSGTPSSWGDGFSGGGIYGTQSGAKIENNNIVDNHCVGGGNAMSGGGMFADTCYNRTVIIRNNLVSENSCIANQSGTQVVTGGGMSILINAVITGNTIKNNYVYHGAGGQALGGGIEGFLSKCIIKNNIIKDNIIENTGNSNQPNGCGIYLQQTQEGTIIFGNWITGNKGIGNMPLGGGIATWNNEGNLIIDNNIIEDNDVCRGSGLRLGVYTNVVEITNNIIRNNFPSANNTNFSRGGGIYITEGSSDSKNIGRMKYRDTEKNSKTNQILSKNLLNVIANNNLLNNSSNDGGGIFVKTAIDNLLAFNNIFYNNSASSQGDAIYLLSNTHLYLYHNNIDPNDISGTGNWEGEGNIFVDPEFDEDGYHLLPTSQCIEAGIQSIEIDEEIYYCPELDIDDEVRPFNTAVDIGVDEWYPETGLVENKISTNNLSLIQVSPNPFTGTTAISFELKTDCFTELSIYDLAGKKIRTLISKNKQSGIYKIEMDGGLLDTGVYFCVLKTNKGIKTRKIIKL